MTAAIRVPISRAQHTTSGIPTASGTPGVRPERQTQGAGVQPDQQRAGRNDDGGDPGETTWLGREQGGRDGDLGDRQQGEKAAGGRPLGRGARE